MFPQHPLDPCSSFLKAVKFRLCKKISAAFISVFPTFYNYFLASTFSAVVATAHPAETSLIKHIFTSRLYTLRLHKEGEKRLINALDTQTSFSSIWQRWTIHLYTMQFYPLTATSGILLKDSSTIHAFFQIRDSTSI